MLSPALHELFQHRVNIDRTKGGDDVIFRWHFPRGLMDERMSALELGEFLMPHMPYILPYFSDHPDIYLAWQTLLVRMVTWPKEVLDEVTPWLRRLPRNEEDEIVELNLRGWYAKNGPFYSLPSGPVVSEKMPPTPSPFRSLLIGA